MVTGGLPNFTPMDAFAPAQCLKAPHLTVLME
jgi:hypothetical protein